MDNTGIFIENIYPRLCGIYRLGGVNTTEGEIYLTKHQTEIDEEFNVLMSEYKYRQSVGGNDIIHKVE